MSGYEPVTGEERPHNESIRCEATGRGEEPARIVTRVDRIAGGLLGVHAGDSLGAAVEFSSWSSIRGRHPEGPQRILGGGPLGWPPGHATDDTDLTRAVLLAYLEPAEDVVRVAAERMMDWLEGKWPGREPGSRPRDIGGATLDGLRRYRKTGDPHAAGAGPGRAGNGSLMRCLPTALAVTDREHRIRESMEISAITHNDERCTVACAAYNEIAAALLCGVTANESVAMGWATARDLGSEPVADAITHGRQLRLATMAETGQISLEHGGAGFVLDSLSLAVAAVLDERPLPQVLIDIVRLGNDTDTNAAIAGGLLGLRDGANAIPDTWRSVLQFADEFSNAAETLDGSHPDQRMTDSTDEPALPNLKPRRETPPKTHTKENDQDDLLPLLNSELVVPTAEDGSMPLLPIGELRILPVFTTPDQLPPELPPGCSTWQRLLGHQVAALMPPDVYLYLAPDNRMVLVEALHRLGIALSTAAEAYHQGKIDESAIREEFRKAIVYCQAGEQPGFVAYSDPEGTVTLILVFTSLWLLQGFLGDTAWFSTTGKDLLDLLPPGNQLVIDPSAAHSIQLDKAGLVCRLPTPAEIAPAQRSQPLTERNEAR